MTSTYDHGAIEAKWQSRWQETGLYQMDLELVPRPYYNLMMFPYPSAEGLHVGNMFAFSGADAHGRFERMQGFDVFEPIGFDAFGIHSENFALKTGRHPTELIANNVVHFREQLRRLGAQFDWTKTVETTDPAYYRWTQWLFLTLWKGGFAYRARRNVKWCPEDLTVLADEQVLADGTCERCGAVVTERELEQWFLRITAFTERLLADLDDLNWSESTKLLQRHWIGRSQGALIDFPIADEDPLRVFSTRPDTLFGATFMVLAPDHPRTLELTAPENRTEVAAFAAEAARRRIAGQREEENSTNGIALGRDALNPLTGERIPLFTAEYVLSGYGTGAIMAVPAHDQRDHAFALRHHLPIVEVVSGRDADRGAHGGSGVLVNSGHFDGLKAPDPAGELVTAALVEAGLGQPHVTYKLRDWGISRQRYWGPPIPAIHCPKCGVVPVPEKDLPVLLPYIEDFRPLGTGESPLARDPNFLNTTCPNCGGPAQRETDVSDTFLDSSWYFLRYPSVGRDDVPFDRELTRQWLPVTYYDGGNEHAVLHLLYSRFVTMALHQLGYLDFDEPFTQFRAHGTIVKGGAKMSKSRGNVVVPDEYIAHFGADAFRLYLLYLGPYHETLNFVDTGINGPFRFLSQLLRLLDRVEPGAGAKEPTELARARHRCIHQVTLDTPECKYNTAIAAMMIFVKRLREHQGAVPQIAIETLALLLAPYCPHLAEEIWERLGHEYSVHQQPWPLADPSLIVDEQVVVVVCINGKKRDQLLVAAGTDAVTLEQMGLALPRIQQWLAGRSVERVFVVPDRQVNLVLAD